jgi:hypothetical protein
VNQVAGGLSKQATESWDRLEQVFEERVARALNRLGVPTHTDIQALIARVDALNASVQALGGKPSRAPRAPRAAAPSAAAPASGARAPRKGAARATQATRATRAPRGTRATKSASAAGR